MADLIPLMLLHGFPMDRRIWDGLVNGLSDVARVVTVDLRGFGEAPDTGPFTIDDLADDIHWLIERIGQPCVVGGLSMGGYVALSLVDRYPSDLRGLILFDTKATADDAAASAKRDEMIDLARTEGAVTVADQMVPRLLSPRADAAVLSAVRAMAEAVPATTITHALAAMRDRPDRSAVLSRIVVPTLAIVGADDLATPPVVVDAMRRQIPGAELVVIPDAGHLTPMEQPTAVTAAVRGFLCA
jgi:pimeloyl-ACP methyl ester carboxylesterase